MPGLFLTLCQKQVNCLVPLAQKQMEKNKWTSSNAMIKGLTISGVLGVCPGVLLGALIGYYFSVASYSINGGEPVDCACAGFRLMFVYSNIIIA